MYLEPWQVFLGGCVIGTLIAFIVLFVMVMNTVNRLGIKGIRVQDISVPDDTEDGEDEELNDDNTDLLAKLTVILLNRGYINESDMDFMTDELTFDEWQNLLKQELKDTGDTDTEE